MIRLNKFLSLFASKKAGKERTKGKNKRKEQNEVLHKRQCQVCNMEIQRRRTVFLSEQICRYCECTSTK